MRLSKLFTKTSKHVSADETSLNAQLLIRGGYIFKEMAGVYTYLPLGLRVLRNVNKIIREEMDSVDGQEIEMTALQSRELWESTNRWDDSVVDNWFKTQLKNGSELGLGFTHEEAITRIMGQNIKSYKDLPVYGYQIQTKFRNETRAKSGIMRCREFPMKDLYSFCKDKDEHDEYYDRVWKAYERIFERVGLGDRTFVTFASGGVFSKFSHEFQTLCDAGEDTIYLDREKGMAVNKEVLTDEVLESLDMKREDLEEVRAAEVGNIFTLGTRFSEPLGVKYADENGEQHPVFMGSYGIGPGRVMGVVVEVHSDERGIVWPESIAPYQVHLTVLGKNEEVWAKAEALYDELRTKGVDVLFDDRPGMGAGQRLGDADLMGMPTRVLISDKSLEAGGAEVTVRKSGETEILPLEKIGERF